ncbi:RAC-alpha serine/threonine-protein kinase [Cymbomonas tetramitiformis]|uniref:RAC-alpha serine/threonine-protein kinase n=1 Tax=Cymbomonas tetramitiformis TaxID=36881 RepID=A0AAE0LDY0_9CHLO|nr:RAC-alpha serine/threonine-protein kinase [Cymbomonas tetramitiformis]
MLRVSARAGANKQAQTNLGHTSLHRAVTFGRTETVKVLLDAGVPVDVVDKQGYTACKLAEDFGHQDIMQLLKAFEAARMDAERHQSSSHAEAPATPQLPPSPVVVPPGPSDCVSQEASALKSPDSLVLSPVLSENTENMCTQIYEESEEQQRELQMMENCIASPHRFMDDFDVESPTAESTMEGEEAAEVLPEDLLVQSFNFEEDRQRLHAQELERRAAAERELQKEIENQLQKNMEATWQEEQDQRSKELQDSASSFRLSDGSEKEAEKAEQARRLMEKEERERELKEEEERQRLRREQAEQDRREREEHERLAQVQREKEAREAAERQREEAEQRERLEQERVHRESEQREREEEEERLRREEDEREKLRREEEEREKLRREEEEREKLRREEEERENARLQRQKEEAEQRLRDEEERERLERERVEREREEEERQRKEKDMAERRRKEKEEADRARALKEEEDRLNEEERLRKRKEQMEREAKEAAFQQREKNLAMLRTACRKQQAEFQKIIGASGWIDPQLTEDKENESKGVAGFMKASKPEVNTRVLAVQKSSCGT